MAAFDVRSITVPQCIKILLSLFSNFKKKKSLFSNHAVMYLNKLYNIGAIVTCDKYLELEYPKL